MGRKKEKRVKTLKEKDQQKEKGGMTAVEITFYELTITDLKNKITRLENYEENIKHADEYINEYMQQEDPETNLIAQLQYQIIEKNGVIRDLDEKVEQLSKIIEKENNVNNKKIKNWENKFKAMEEQLSSEIKLLNGKLNVLDEFRLERANLLMKLEERAEELHVENRAQQDELHEIDQRNKLKTDKLKAKIQTQLLELAENCTKSSEIRISAYMQRLIRENIALNTEMVKIAQLEMTIKEENKKMRERILHIERSNANCKIVKEALTRTCEKNIKLIQNLTEKYEKLQCTYYKIKYYKTLYETSMKKDIYDKFNYKIAKKLRIMAHQILKLKVDNQEMVSMEQKHEEEIIRLQNILKQIKLNVQSAIRGELDDNDDPEFRVAQKKNIFTDVMNILKKCFDHITLKPSVTTISNISSSLESGFTKFSPKITTELLNFLKCNVEEITVPELKYSPSSTTIEEPLQNDTVIDVESGSTITYSTTREEVGAPPNNALEDENGLSSSDEGDFTASASHSKQESDKIEGSGKTQKKHFAGDEEKKGIGEEMDEVRRGEEGEHEKAERPSRMALSKEEHVSGPEAEAESAALFEAMTEADEKEDETDFFY